MCSPYRTVLIFRRWLTGYLLFFCISCSQDKKNDQVLQPVTPSTFTDSININQLIAGIRDSIKSGDMITRTGNDFTSYCLIQFCQLDKTYSHCGIASIEHDTIFVYHALGGEFNPDQKLIREPLHYFISPLANRGFGIYRFPLKAPNMEKLKSFINHSYMEGLPFDMQFDLETDDKMYCSEFTAKSYQQAFENDSLFRVSALGSFRYFSPDNLFTHPLSKKIYEIKYP